MSLHNAPAEKIWPGFPDAGEMATLVGAYDWSATPLGPIEAWPQSLKTAVDLMLSSRQPVYVAWGAELTSLYNDGYIPIVGAKHPDGLGQPFDVLWSEILEEYRPLVEAVMAGEPLHFVDRPAALAGRDGLEVGYFTFSWTPLRDEAGAIQGFICNGLETTERVEAGRAFRRMFEGSPTPFLVLAPDAPCFTIVEVNDAYLKAVMRKREDLLGCGVFEAMPDNPTDPNATGVANLRASLERAIATRRPDKMARQKYDIPHPSGGFEERWWDPVNSPLLGAGGQVEAIIHHVADVTAQHQMEERLRDSEAKLRAIVEQAPLAMALTGESGEILFRNARFDELWGRPPHVTTARTYSEVYEGYHLDGRPVASEEWPGARALFEGEVVDNDVYEIVQANGQRITCWFGGAPIRNASGEIAGAVVVFRDVSEERRNEARLRELNETLESEVAARTAERDRMWESSPDLMLVIDFEGFFRRVNPAWTALLGYNVDELVGHHVNEFVLPEDHAATVDAYESAAGGGRPTVVNRHRHKDGSTRWISWVAAPAGNVTYATGRDITAEMARALELAQAQEQLRQSQKMESMGQLTGGVAHDFNNLLMPIIGSLDMLVRRELGTERERRLIDGALQSAERAKTLVQRLLAFARRQPLQATAVDLKQLIANMADLVDSTSGPRVDVGVDIQEGLPPARVDPNQLEMAILNLAVNARDAMPGGGVLTIAASAQPVRSGELAGLQPGDYVRLSIADTGVGMDELTRARAIEPFFSTKGIGKGTGLGLSMVHGLASQLGGCLTIDSKVGNGTTVSLWLPVSAAPPTDLQRANPSRPIQAAGTALLVDDEDLVRLTTADMLMDLGFEVVEANSGHEALRLLAEGLQPTLLVTDHLMPGLNGADLAREVRATRADLPILIISGYAEAEGLPADLARLTKPFRNAELAERLGALGALVPPMEDRHSPQV